MDFLMTKCADWKNYLYHALWKEIHLSIYSKIWIVFMFIKPLRKFKPLCLITYLQAMFILKIIVLQNVSLQTSLYKILRWILTSGYSTCTGSRFVKHCIYSCTNVCCWYEPPLQRFKIPKANLVFVWIENVLH